MLAPVQQVRTLGASSPLHAVSIGVWDCECVSADGKVSTSVDAVKGKAVASAHLGRQMQVFCTG